MEFEQLGRKELQALAKQYKIKANLSNAALVEALKNAIVQDYENSMLEEDEEETHDMQIDQPQVVENVEISAEEQNIVEDVAPSVIAVESVPVPEPSPVIVEAEAPKITGKKRIIAPSVIAVEPVSVPEPEPSSVIVETEAPKITGKKRKAVTIALPSEVEEIAGPFSVEREAVETNSPLFSRKKEQDSKEAEPQKFILEKKSTINSADWKVGDKVQVCVDSVWITSVIKRVNKASFRVQMNSGEEATVKQTEILPVVTESQEKTTADDASESAEVLPPTEAIENCPQTTELQQDDIFEPNPNEDFMILNDSVVFEESDEESAPHANDESEQTIVEKPISITKSPAVSRHSIALMGTPSTTSKSKLIGCSAAKSVSRKSTSAISGSLTPSRRTSSTATLPWNSSTKPTFHVGSDDHNAGKTSGSERKKKPITPSRTQTSLAPVPQPAIVPKMNAAQRMRLEALQKKMEAEKSISLTLSSNAAFTLASGTGSATLHRSNSSSTQPPPLKKARTVPTPLSTGPTKTSTSTLPLTKSNDRTKTPSNHYLPHVATVKPKIQLSSVLEDEAKNIPTTTSAEAVSVKPKTTASTVSNSTASTAPSAARKTTTPNFDRLHQKSFERQKSLTSCVARDNKINKNMDSAFAKATEITKSTSAASTDAPTLKQSIEDRENVPLNTAAASKAFVTKRKAHVAFERNGKDSDQFGSLLIQETLDNPLISVPESLPAVKKLKLTSTEELSSTSRKSEGGAAVSLSTKRKTLSVADKTTAAAVASKAKALSRKSEVRKSLMNSRKSIRL